MRLWAAMAALAGAAALVVSIIALLWSRRTAARQHALQEQITSIERARREDEIEKSKTARLQVKVRRTRQVHQQRVLVTNHGPAVAREVRLEVRQYNHKGYREVGPDHFGHQQPIKVLDVGNTYELVASVDHSAPPWVVGVNWIDDRGPQEKVVSLTYEDE